MPRSERRPRRAAVTKARAKRSGIVTSARKAASGNAAGRASRTVVRSRSARSAGCTRSNGGGGGEQRPAAGRPREPERQGRDGGAPEQGAVPLVDPVPLRAGAVQGRPLGVGGPGPNRPRPPLAGAGHSRVVPAHVGSDPVHLPP